MKNKGLDNLKAVCNCNIKEKYSINNKLKKEEKIPQIKTLNIEVIKCLNVLNKNNSLKSNINFWIFLIIIIIQMSFLFNVCCKGKNEIYKILEIENDIIEEININQNENIINNPPKRSLLSFLTGQKNRNKRDEDSNRDDKKIKKKLI